MAHVLDLLPSDPQNTSNPLPHGNVINFTFFFFLSAPKGEEGKPCFAPRHFELPLPGHRIPESTHAETVAATESICKGICGCTLMGLIVAVPHNSRKANGRRQDTLERRGTRQVWKRPHQKAEIFPI